MFIIYTYINTNIGNMVCTQVLRDDKIQTIVEINSITIPIDKLASILGISVSSLIKSMNTQTIVINKKRISIETKILTLLETQNNILALIKYLYNHIFLWIVKKINYVDTQSNTEITTNSIQIISENAEKDNYYIGKYYTY